MSHAGHCLKSSDSWNLQFSTFEFVYVCVYVFYSVPAGQIQISHSLVSHVCKRSHPIHCQLRMILFMMVKVKVVPLITLAVLVLITCTSRSENSISVPPSPSQVEIDDAIQPPLKRRKSTHELDDALICHLQGGD